MFQRNLQNLRNLELDNLIVDTNLNVSGTLQSNITNNLSISYTNQQTDSSFEIHPAAKQKYLGHTQGDYSGSNYFDVLMDGISLYSVKASAKFTYVFRASL